MTDPVPKPPPGGVPPGAAPPGSEFQGRVARVRPLTWSTPAGRVALLGLASMVCVAFAGLGCVLGIITLTQIPSARRATVSDPAGRTYVNTGMILAGTAIVVSAFFLLQYLRILGLLAAL